MRLLQRIRIEALESQGGRNTAAMAYSPIKMALFRNSGLPLEKPESKSREQVESYVYAYGDYAIHE